MDLLGEVVGEVFDTVLGAVLIPVVASVLLTWGVCTGETVGLALLLGVGVPLEPDGVVAMVTELVVPDEDETTDDADGPDEEETDEVVQVEEEDEPPFGFEIPNCVEY